MRQAPSLLCLAAAVGLLVGCWTPGAYFTVGGRAERRVLRELFTQLDDEDGRARFTVVRTVSDILRRTGNVPKQILFLAQYVERNPGDPYNSFYLFEVAGSYEETEAFPFADHYYERILKNYPDIMVGGSSVHYLCLSQLIRHVQDRERLIAYHKELISRFGDTIDIGLHWYYLAKTYEEVGSWNLAIQAYKRFLQMPDTRIPGRPEAHGEIAQKVAFYDSRKDWTVSDLQFLVSEIRTGLVTNNVRMLNQYRARISFFSKYWGQKDFAESQARVFDISNWILKSRIRVAAELEPESNSREAYLKTWNWLYRVGTWYLYFRRVDFPADPEIDGRWEWAGIYFGEKG